VFLEGGEDSEDVLHDEVGEDNGKDDKEWKGFVQIVVDCPLLANILDLVIETLSAETF